MSLSVQSFPGSNVCSILASLAARGRTSRRTAARGASEVSYDCRQEVVGRSPPSQAGEDGLKRVFCHLSGKSTEVRQKREVADVKIPKSPPY